MICLMKNLIEISQHQPRVARVTPDTFQCIPRLVSLAKLSSAIDYCQSHNTCAESLNNNIHMILQETQELHLNIIIPVQRNASTPPRTSNRVCITITKGTRNFIGSVTR